MPLSRISFCYCYWNQPKMLKRLLDEFRAYPQEAKDQLELVFADDGSRKHPAEPLLRENPTGIPTKLFRIETDIPWNQMGARNLAMSKASNDLVYGLDMDHMVRKEWILRFLRADWKRKHIYKVDRYRQEPESKLKVGCNIFLVHKEDFLSVGGYDEDYRGHKGWSDTMLIAVIRAKGVKLEIKWDLRIHCFCDWDEGGKSIHKSIPDASIRHEQLNRNLSHNKLLRERKAKYIKKHGVDRYIRYVKETGILRFPWQEVVL